MKRIVLTLLTVFAFLLCKAQNDVLTNRLTLSKVRVDSISRDSIRNTGKNNNLITEAAAKAYARLVSGAGGTIINLTGGVKTTVTGTYPNLQVNVSGTFDSTWVPNAHSKAYYDALYLGIGAIFDSTKVTGLHTQGYYDVRYDGRFLKPTNNLSDVTNSITALSNLGFTTVGQAFAKLANPFNNRYIKINSDNSVSARNPNQMLQDLGISLLANASGSANTYVVLFWTIDGTAYYPGAQYWVKFAVANTGASTIDIGQGAKTIVKGANTPLAAGDIVVNKVYKLVYDGTNFQMINPGDVPGSGGGGGGSGLSVSQVDSIAYLASVRATKDSTKRYYIRNSNGAIKLGTAKSDSVFVISGLTADSNIVITPYIDNNGDTAYKIKAAVPTSVTNVVLLNDSTLQITKSNGTTSTLHLPIALPGVDGGGSQTPWLTTIDGNQQKLLNVLQLSVKKQVASTGENAVLMSGQMEDSTIAWSHSNMVITPNQGIDLDGNTTLDLLTMKDNTGGAIEQIVNVLPNTRYFLSFDAKQGTITGAEYYIADWGNTYSVIVNNTSYAISPTVTRFQFGFTTPSGTTQIKFRPFNNPFSTGNLYLGRVMIARDSLAVYQATTTSAATGTTSQIVNVLNTDTAFGGRVAIGKAIASATLDVGGQVHIDNIPNGTAGTDSTLVTNAGVIKKVRSIVSPEIVASQDNVARTANSTLISYNNGGTDASYSISAAMYVSTLPSGTVYINVAYIDINGVSRLINFYNQGATSMGMSTTGGSNFPPIGEIRVKAGTNISIAALWTGGPGAGLLYDVSATIYKIR